MSRVIAIVEDDVDQRDNYADALRNQGYEIITFGSRPEALAHFQNSGSQLPDLAILDIMLEKEMDGGFDLCRELRALSPNLPIIFLTARDSDIDRVSGLRLDAWDYLTKPLSPEVLGVRVATLFRIVESLSKGGVTSNPSEGVLHRGDLEIDPNSMSISWKGEHLNFTLTEFWLVEALARRPGMVKSYDNLMQVTRQTYVERNTINGYVRRVRRKFKEIDPSFECMFLDSRSASVSNYWFSDVVLHAPGVHPGRKHFRYNSRLQDKKQNGLIGQSKYPSSRIM